jgi:NADPH-dependent 2,4-dienoyl-CoA reductase/sulfur reductase-like enzyme
MSRLERVVVVGAGLAGLRAAERLRELGFNGELLIIGSEGTAPYHRPALSKQLLTGAMKPVDLMLPAYREIGAKWRLNTPAAYLVPQKRIVRLPGGEDLQYDGLVIATGMEARRIPGVPYHDPRVQGLRTMQDALAIERAVSAGRGPVAIVGGGFTGCEIACSLRHLNHEVTIIGRGSNLLGNVLGPQLGNWMTEMHRNHHVDLALETSVRHWVPRPDGIELHLSDGTFMLASCAVVAAGTVPATSWLRGSGLPLDDGVVCEPTCHVVGAEDVVAAGDVAQWPNLRFDDKPRRIEHWLNAVEMGRAAAESLLAGRAAARPFTPMPRFWTEQFGVRIQAAGVPKMGTETISLGTPAEGNGTVVGYMNEGRLMGVIGIDSPGAVLTWTETVMRHNPAPGERPVPVDPRPIPAEAMAARQPNRARVTGRHSLPTERQLQKVDRPAQRANPVRSPQFAPAY